LQGEPGVGGALADAAVGDHRLCGIEAELAGVDRLELGARAETAVLGGGAGPGHGVRGGDVPAAHGALLRVVGHVGGLPVYSCGERTSTSWPPRKSSTSSRKARIGASLRSVTGYPEPEGTSATVATSVVISRPSASQAARPPSSRRTSVWPNSSNTHRAE